MRCLSGFLCALALLAWPGPGHGRGRTLALKPDPSCRASKLVLPVQRALSERLSVPGLHILDKEPDKARLVLEFFVMAHPRSGQVAVQLDAQVFDKRDGKLLAEGSLRSDAFADDESGRQQAALQAGRAMAERLSAALERAFARSGKGRRVMLQVKLDAELASSRDAIVDQLQRGLSAMSPKLRGSTERNLIVTLVTSKRPKPLSERIEEILGQGFRLTWVMRDDNSMMLQLAPGQR
ncbi:MAG: hypothetical protein JXR96_08960 [Deltaproteobacteria bacterium]|nr:hypothetical protein [Deltaproteobacteria bacterium]